MSTQKNIQSDCFSFRLKEVINPLSVRKFGEKTGLSAGVLNQYLWGKSKPGLDALITIAHATNVNLQWLATGEGPMRPGEIDYQGEGVENAQLFDKVVRVLEDALDEADLYIPAKDKGNVIREVYQEALAEEKAGRDATQKIKAVAKIIKLAEHRKRGKA